MTCIVGLVDGDDVYIGGDSAAVWGDEIRRINDKKVFRSGKFLIGCAGSVRMHQLLQYHLHIKMQRQDQGVMHYMVNDFVDAVRECFKTHGFSKIENNEEFGGTFLVGYRGRLFCIHTDFQVDENHDGREAIGSGRAYALGALLTTSEMLSPGDRIKKALWAASYFSSSVIGPHYVLKAGK